MQIDLDKITRIEVIDENWRQYVNNSLKIREVSIQDWKKTMKIFIKNTIDEKLEAYKKLLLDKIENLKKSKI